MKWLDNKTILLERELSDLDKLVLKFSSILEKHTSYIIISGYAAILFGRTRTTEDVDIFIPKITKEQFSSLYEELREQGFWAINGDTVETLFSLLSQERTAVRFAEKGKVFPNFEVKFVKDALDEFALREKIKVITNGGNLFTSLIDLQIAYKKFVLKSQKDLEDARHLQNWFSISDENINKYKHLLKQYGRL